MNILYISLDDPRKTSTGSNQRNHFLWKALQRIGTVYAVYAVGPTSAPVDDKVDRVRSVCLKPSSWVEAKIRWFFRGLIKYGNWPFRDVAKVRRAIGWADVRFDIVVARCLGTASSLVAWKVAPLYVDIDDVPTLAFESVLKQMLPRFVVPLSRFLIHWWQRYVIEKCTGVWIVKDTDKSELPEATHYSLLPNISNTPSGLYSFEMLENCKSLIFIGNMGYSPNSEGVSWFLDTVWPVFYASHKDWVFRVIGGNASETDKQRWKAVSGVEVMGFVEDIECIYEKAYAVVAPINSGAGTCIKVIEGVVYGKKTFATPFAARGMSEDCIRDLGIDIFRDAKEFVRKFSDWVQIESDERKRLLVQFSANARNAYSFDGFCNSVMGMLKND